MEFSNLFKQSNLLIQLTNAELNAQYKQKALGLLWALLDPIFLMLTYWVLVSVIFKRGGEYYPALLFVSILSWRWFLQSALGSVRLFTSNAQLLQTVRFPYSVLPISKNLLHSINFIMGLIALIPLMVILGVKPTFHVFWLLLILPIQFLFNVGVSISFSIIGVYFRDLYNILTFVLRLLFYASPGLYMMSDVPSQYQTLMMSINPFASLFESYKNVIILGEPPSPYLILPFAISIVALYFVNHYLTHQNRLTKDL